MARPPKGKPLTLRPIRLDDDVWAECQRLGKEHGTINEGLRLRLLPEPITSEMLERIPLYQTKPPCAEPCKHFECEIQRERRNKARAFKGPLLRPKDKKK